MLLHECRASCDSGDIDSVDVPAVPRRREHPVDEVHAVVDRRAVQVVVAEEAVADAAVVAGVEEPRLVRRRGADGEDGREPLRRRRRIDPRRERCARPPPASSVRERHLARRLAVEDDAVAELPRARGHAAGDRAVVLSEAVGERRRSRRSRRSATPRRSRWRTPSPHRAREPRRGRRSAARSSSAGWRGRRAPTRRGRPSTCSTPCAPTRAPCRPAARSRCRRRRCAPRSRGSNHP